MHHELLHRRKKFPLIGNYPVSNYCKKSVILFWGCFNVRMKLSIVNMSHSSGDGFFVY